MEGGSYSGRAEAKGEAVKAVQTAQPWRSTMFLRERDRHPAQTGSLPRSHPGYSFFKRGVVQNIEEFFVVENEPR